MNHGIQAADPEAAMAEAAKRASTDIAKARDSYRSGLMPATGIEDESQNVAAKEDKLRTGQQRN